jgi:hypothetical protein
MVQMSSVLALAATHVFGSAVAKPADDTQHVLTDPQVESAKDFYKVKDE